MKLEFKTQPVGTLTATVGNVEIDLWKVHGQGWKYTMSRKNSRNGLGLFDVECALLFDTKEKAEAMIVAHLKRLTCGYCAGTGQDGDESGWLDAPCRECAGSGMVVALE